MSRDLSGALTKFAEDKKLADLVELAEFCQVVAGTALGWTEAGMLPKGETLIRLQHYLAALGYSIDELDHLPAPAFKLGQAIAFGTVTVSMAADALDYSSFTGLYRVVQGSGLTAERAGMLQLLNEQYAEETEARVAQFVNRHASETPAPSLVIDSPSPATLHLPSEILARGVNQAVATLDVVLELVDQNPEAAKSLGDRVDTAKINSTIARLMRNIDEKKAD